MNTSSYKILLSLALSLFVIDALKGQTAPNPARTSAPAGLLRLRDSGKPSDPARLAATKFTVDDLSPRGAAGAVNRKKGDADVLVLDAAREWSRPLRGLVRDVVFVSFQLYASHSTIVEVAGVRLGVLTGPILGSFQLVFDDSVTSVPQWKPLNSHFGADLFDGKLLAMAPTLTLRIDPEAGVWDAFSDSRLLADNLPLHPSRKTQREFLLRAGSDGAWISSLVMSDENPLYEDDNANGIDDRFETEKRGALLPALASVQERTFLAQQWKEAQRKKAPPALHVSRPMPDGAVAAPAPKK